MLRYDGEVLPIPIHENTPSSVMPAPTLHAREQGFTLVELSIVLVIIGLIVGAVLLGRDLIRQAEVRSVISDLDRYKAAVYTFKGKYNCLPGDCRNATAFFSGVTNGDNDGRIEFTGSANNPVEIYGAWQQLALAGLIEGAYTGLAGPNNAYHSVIGVNVPASKMPNGGYTLYYQGNPSGGANVYDGYYGNFIWVGRATPITVTNDHIFTPQEAYTLDAKMDDKIPGTGNIRTYCSATTCNTGTCNNPTASYYNPSNETVACMLMFITGY